MVKAQLLDVRKQTGFVQEIFETLIVIAPVVLLMEYDAALRANISETVLVLLINEQGEKEEDRDERQFSWC